MREVFQFLQGLRSMKAIPFVMNAGQGWLGLGLAKQSLSLLCPIEMEDRYY